MAIATAEPLPAAASTPTSIDEGHVLFAHNPNIDGGIYPVLAVIGDELLIQVERLSAEMTEFLPLKQLPDKLGLYVWSGKVIPSTSPWDARWKGSWKPVTAAILSSFGFYVPLTIDGG